MICRAEPVGVDRAVELCPGRRNIGRPVGVDCRRVCRRRWCDGSAGGDEHAEFRSCMCPCSLADRTCGDQSRHRNRNGSRVGTGCDYDAGVHRIDDGIVVAAFEHSRKVNGDRALVVPVEYRDVCTPCLVLIRSHEHLHAARQAPGPGIVREERGHV